MISTSLVSLIPDHPSKVLFWTGAGISIDPPSSLPSGYTLTKDIVDSFCTPGTWERILFFLENVKYCSLAEDIMPIPRLESILGNIVSLFGADFLLRFYSLDPTPNSYHFFFAEHLLRHGKHITLNLDLGIENALRKMHKVNPSVYPLHLHGDFSQGPLELGLTFENISRGLPKNLSTQATSYIDSSDVLIFAGYSGSDFFDINPFFSSMIGKTDLSEKIIIWIAYSKEYCFCIDYHLSDHKLMILDALSKCGAKCFIWKGPPWVFLGDLAKHWAIPNPVEGVVASETKEIPRFDKQVFQWQKYLITAKIYISMGLGKEAYDILQQYGHSLRLLYKQYCVGRRDLNEISPGMTFDYLVNEARRERGMYADAASISKRFEVVTYVDRMLYYERRASDARLIGNWLRARKIYAQAIRFGQSRVGLSRRFDSIFLEALRGYMQLCRDICSTRWLASLFAKEDIISLTLMISNDSALQAIIQKSPYDMSHIARLFTWEKKYLPNEINAVLPNSIVNETNIIPVFAETDNLLGVINARRSRLRALLSEGLEVSREEILELIALSHIVGDNPGVCKACMLLVSVGAVGPNSVKLFLHALCQTQWLVPIKALMLLRFMSKLILRKLHANNQIQKTGAESNINA